MLFLTIFLKKKRISVKNILVLRDVQNVRFIRFPSSLLIANNFFPSIVYSNLYSKTLSNASVAIQNTDSVPASMRFFRQVKHTARLQSILKIGKLKSNLNGYCRTYLNELKKRKTKEKKQAKYNLIHKKNKRHMLTFLL